MDLIKEFSYSLAEALGEDEAKKYRIVVWNELERSAIAYSEKNHDMYMLFKNENYISISEDLYLDLAKEINNKHHCFVAPSHRVEHRSYWAAKTDGAVFSYKFKVFKAPYIL